MTTIDYFTREAFREFAGDTPAEKYDDAQIDMAQEEVIATLEEWAHCAWPNVTGVAGDGTALARRSTTDIFDGGPGPFVLTKWPVFAISDITVDGDALAADGYYLYNESGVLRPVNAIMPVPRILVVTYTYGFNACPPQVKRPAMMATKTRLDQGQFSNRRTDKIPRRVTQYNTEGTTFQMNLSGEEDADPWPWDPDSARDVRSYFARTRRHTMGAMV